MGNTYTSGPWSIENPSKGSPCHTITGGLTNAEIAYVHAGEADQGANARLIAAAPELLAACQYMVENLPNEACWMGPVEILKAAIAKATGGAK